MLEHNAYFVIIQGQQETFPHDITEEEQKIMGDHANYLQGLIEVGKLILAGRNLDNDKGYIILKTKSLDEAKSLMADDPSVKSGVVTPTYERYRIAFLNCD
ncbi:MAG: YciI family protein [Candidatus Hodarchaeales archaeon]